MTFTGLLLTLVTASVPAGVPSGPQPIRDNSFLVEEAYNQEEGVVQHISSFTRSSPGGDWVYTFTQEWPVTGVRHQLSFSLPVSDTHDAGGAGAGIGDLALNYRYQLAGNGDERVALAPRFTLILPIGTPARGGGGFGIQWNLPVSVALSEHLVSHYNAGLTYVPSAENAAGDRARTISYNVGLGVVWLVARRFNLLFEAVGARADAVIGPGRTLADESVVLSPGMRWSHDFSNGLQIVPGIAWPFTVRGPGGRGGVLLYLSFEHPFRRRLQPPTAAR